VTYPGSNLPAPSVSLESSTTPTFHVVLVADGLAGFPEGYATVQYVRRLAKGLVASGVSVNVLIPRWINKALRVQSEVRGAIDGIEFEHLAGVVGGSYSRPQRLWFLLRSRFMLAHRLRRLHRQGRLDVVVYSPWEFHCLESLRRTCRVLKIPLVLHFMEWPLVWKDRSEAERRLFASVYSRALRYADGFVVISHYLTERCHEAIRSRGLAGPVIRLPILLDTQAWQSVGRVPRTRPSFLYCADLDGFLDDALFLVEAFHHSGCAGYDLIMIGQASDATRNSIQTAAQRWGLSGQVEIVSKYLPQTELLGFYASADALLAPLPDDDASRARFPSKLADYLYSGRPVVSNSVGEVGRYLADGVSGFLAPPGDPTLFGQKMREAVTHPDRFVIGERGKRLAEAEFALNVQGQRLASFLQSLTPRPS
jgi:glycosyltransferase involved in cell wall biosynthesis